MAIFGWGAIFGRREKGKLERENLEETERERDVWSVREVSIEKGNLSKEGWKREVFFNFYFILFLDSFLEVL